MNKTLNGLLISRKFWLAVFGVITAIVAEYLNVPADIWISIEVLVLAVIAGITVEDAAAKRAIYAAEPRIWSLDDDAE